jgi:hypothetical protein
VRRLPVVVPIAAVDPVRQPLFDRARLAGGLALVRANTSSFSLLETELARNRVVTVMVDRRPICQTSRREATGKVFDHHVPRGEIEGVRDA